MKWLGFRVPLAIVNKAHQVGTSIATNKRDDDVIMFYQANQLYPFAISLKESIRTYESVLRKVEDRPDVKPLLAQHRKDLYSLFKEVHLASFNLPLLTSTLQGWDCLGSPTNLILMSKNWLNKFLHLKKRLMSCLK